MKSGTDNEMSGANLRRTKGLIVSHILGGLGNQMFQYAFARALATESNRQLLFDLRDYSSYRLHNGFELSHVFDLDIEEADADAIKRVLGWKASFLARRIVRRPGFSIFRGRRFLTDQLPEQIDLSDVTGDCYLMGYWQSERYFQLQRDLIQREFTFKQPLSQQNLECSQRITDSESVSLHVRRGDYVSDPKTAKIMRSSSLEYYRNAIAHIAERVQKPQFYVFSDDVAWVEAHVEIPFPHTYVDWNQGSNSHVDMRLMSLCKHQIIANSSFSWWAAWLNRSPEKIVIAPALWFVTGVSGTDPVPSQWLRL
jgi:Glycosyl transferase family 11